jgi:hypothetical protein
MHPDLAELLSLRDHPQTGGLGPDGAASQHVAGCAICSAELERLRRLRVAMQNVPVPAGRDQWQEIAARLDGRSPARQWPRPGWGLAGGLAATLAVAVGVALFRGPATHIAVTSATAGGGTSGELPADSVASLMEESKRLESVLAAFPAEPRVARAGTVLTAAGLEDRIEWIDLALGAPNTGNFEITAAAPLWRQRVDLLNSLVAVRYAQVRTASF